MAIRRMDVTEDPERRSKRSKLRKKGSILLAILVIILLCIGLYFIITSGKDNKDVLVPDDPEIQLPASPSHYHHFKKAAVCTDGPPCSTIGRDILLRNGSAVDAAIAALICNGIVNIQSMGFGGGFMMTIYNKTSGQAITLNARDAAPMAATPDMYKDKPEAARKGPLSIAVPGELKGYWAAYKKFGELPWNELVKPSLELCKTGFNMSDVLWSTVSTSDAVKTDPHLREMFFDEEKGELRKGLIMPNKAYCKTLEIIAEKGGDELYEGELSKVFLEDLQELGSIITKEDLKAYRPKWSPPFTMKLNNEDTFYSMPPPGSGSLIGFILSVLSGYDFNKESISDTNTTVLTYHRIIETFKHAFAKRTYLGDPNFVDFSRVIKNFTSPEFIKAVRDSINDTAAITDPKKFGGYFYNQPDHGTAHVSILAPNGDAVSVTSSINFYFGSGLTTKRTGIVMNDCMDDFSSQGFNNAFELIGSPANAIQPEKRPLSSMSPSIITDKNGDVKVVIGASGGTKIITAISLVLIRNLWFEQTIKESVDAPRIHHQLFPMEISYEYGNLKPVIQGLQKLGHKTSRYRERGSIICALFRNETGIYANADYRKGGDVFGID